LPKSLLVHNLFKSTIGKGMMTPTGFLAMLVQAFNPNQYGKLVDRPAKDFFFFTVWLISITAFIFTALIIPISLHYVASLEDRISAVQEFSINATVVSSSPIRLLEQPIITLDPQMNTTRSGDITLSNDGIIYPKYILFGTSTIPWSKVTNLKERTIERDLMLLAIGLFLLPSIIIWFLVLGVSVVLACAITSAIIGSFLPKLFSHSISFSESCKVAIAALPSSLILSVGLYPLAATPVLVVGVILSVAYFTIGIAAVSERVVPERRENIKGR
jgi:hypothetical protein